MHLQLTMDQNMGKKFSENLNGFIASKELHCNLIFQGNFRL